MLAVGGCWLCLAGAQCPAGDGWTLLQPLVVGRARAPGAGGADSEQLVDSFGSNIKTDVCCLT